MTPYRPQVSVSAMPSERIRAELQKTTDDYYAAKGLEWEIQETTLPSGGRGWKCQFYRDGAPEVFS